MKYLLLISIFYGLSLSGFSQEREYSFVFLNDNPNKPDIPKHSVDSLQQLHLQNIGKMVRQGKLSVAGPFEGGGGFFILNTSDTKKAKNWLASDPAIAAERFRIEILPWQPREGSVCIVDESVEMVSYTFVRYNTNITKFNVRVAPELFQQHEEYIKQIVKTGNVISEGVFANSDGGMMVLKGSVDPNVVMNDPTVANGIIEPIIKRVWVGKGSFCE
ncbi:MAG: hypothetical protein AAFN93_23180 [Bacteroidota bacterium]